MRALEALKDLESRDIKVVSNAQALEASRKWRHSFTNREYQAKQESDAIYETSAKENEPNTITHELSLVTFLSLHRPNLDFGQGFSATSYSELGMVTCFEATTVEMQAKAEKK